MLWVAGTASTEFVLLHQSCESQRSLSGSADVLHQVVQLYFTRLLTVQMYFHKVVQLYVRRPLAVSTFIGQ